MEKPTPEQQEKAEQLLRQMSVFRLRDNKELADKALQEAAAIAPGSVEVILAMHEDLMARKQFAKAEQLLSEAVQIYPIHPQIEGLYGEAVLRKLGAGDPLSFSDKAEFTKSASLLSGLLPGAGQIVMGELTTGITMAGIFVTSMVWAFLIPNGLSGLMGVVGIGKTRATEFNGLVLLPLFCALAAYVWSVTDASSRSKRAVKVVKKEHPVPPVDRPF